MFCATLLCDSADFHDYHHRLLYTKSGNYSSTFTYMDWWELSPFLQSFADCSNQPNFFSYFCLSHIFFSDHRSCSWWLTCTPFSGVSHLWGNSFVLCLVMLLRFSVSPVGSCRFCIKDADFAVVMVMHRIFGTDKGYRKLKALKRNEDHSENIVREVDNLVKAEWNKDF